MICLISLLDCADKDTEPSQGGRLKRGKKKGSKTFPRQGPHQKNPLLKGDGSYETLDPLPNSDACASGDLGPGPCSDGNTACQKVKKALHLSQV